MAIGELRSGGEIDGGLPLNGQIIGVLSVNNLMDGEVSTSGEVLGTMIAQKGARGVGIDNIAKTGTSGLVDTYTITYTDHSTDTFEVTNGAQGETGATGNGISDISKTSTAGLVDTYTITYTNGDTETFDVTNGADGVSPTITTSKSGKTTTLTIVDAGGTTTATILDGDDGADGQDGQDGFSPTITSNKVGKTTTLTITDVNGTRYATILDGADGQGAGDMLKSVYDTDDDGIVDNAELVNSHSVDADVPSTAKFTDTKPFYITTSTPSADLITIGQEIYDAYKDGEYLEVVLLNAINDYAAHLFYSTSTIDGSGTGAMFLKGQIDSTSLGNTNYGINYKYAKDFTFTINVASDVVTSVGITDGAHGYLPADADKILGMNNTTSWTPSSDYQPATKKYVDDNNKVIEVDLGAGSSSSSPFLFSGKKPGLYNVQGASTAAKYFKGTNTDTTTEYWGCNYLFIVADYDTASNDDVVAYIDFMRGSTSNIQQCIAPVLKDNSKTSGIKHGTISSVNFATGIVTTGDAQTISSVKTFSSLPESSVTPTTADQLTRKEYVDGLSREIAVDSDAGNSSSTPFIFTGKKPGYYNVVGETGTRYFKGASTDTTTETSSAQTIIIIADYATASNNDVVAYIEYIDRNGAQLYKRLKPVSKSTGTSGITIGTTISQSIAANICTTNSAQTISAVKTFSALPKSSITPTDNSELTRKKYVDDSVSTKQDTLVSGTNIKSVNSTSLLGSGNFNIVDSGSNANGSYAKFADGTLVCWKTIEGTTDVTQSTMGGTLYYAAVDMGATPYTFTARPTIIASLNNAIGTQCFLIGQASGGNGSTTTFGQQSIARTNSRTGLQYVLDVVGIGKWK